MACACALLHEILVLYYSCKAAEEVWVPMQWMHHAQHGAPLSLPDYAPLHERCGLQLDMIHCRELTSTLLQSKGVQR